MAKPSGPLSSALDHHRAGRLQQAAALYQQLLSSDPKHPDALHLLGVLSHQLGKHNLAVDLIARAIAIRPGAADYYSNLGNAQKAHGCARDAEASYRKAISLAPVHVDAYKNLGLLLEGQGRLEEARDCYKRVLRSAPEAVSVQLSLAKVSVALGDRDRGIQLLEELIVRSPQFVPAHIELGNAWLKRDDDDRAKACYLRALQIDPTSADALFNLGRVYLAAKDYAAAVKVYERAAALPPVRADVYNNLGLAYSGLEQMDLATAAFHRAIEADASYAAAYFNLAHVFTHQKEYRKAADALEEAVCLDPQHATAHWNLGTTLLLLGDYARGWQEYEWRWQRETFTSPRRNFVQPQWRGEPLDGTTILLHAEQGFGDTLQFVRYAPMVAGRGGRVLLEVPPRLKSLLQRVPGVAQCIGKDEPLPDFGWHCPLMSLPLAFGTTSDSIPPPHPDLFGESTHCPAPSERKSGPLRVGLVWAGNANHPNDRLRSIPLAMLAPLVAVDGAEFFSLQKGDAAMQRGGEAWPADQLPALLSEAEDFAGDRLRIAEFDLVITVDTSMAHLAGSMGMPVWILLSNKPDWRWGLTSETTPWYPTARLFRSAADGGWDEVIQRVAGELRMLMQATVLPSR